MDPSDSIGLVLALVLAASALYRTFVGRRESLTVGLWAAAFAMAIGAMVGPLDTALKNITGLDNLSQPIGYSAMVISSYLIARMTYYIAHIDSYWPMALTAASITGMIAIYCATELRHTQSLAIETVPGAASAWFAIFLAIGLLPTHISAIIGVSRMTHKDHIMVWLLAIYGAVGALYPVLIVADHIGTSTLRWSFSGLFALVWVILLISFAALAFAGVLGAYRIKQDYRVPEELPAR